MTVAIYVTSEKDATSLIPWGVRFAQADQTELLVVTPKRSKEKKHEWKKLDPDSADATSLSKCIFETIGAQDGSQVVLKDHLKEGVDGSELDRVEIEIKQLVAASPERAFTEEVADLDVTLLLVSAHQFVESTDAWCQELFKTAPCDTLLIAGIPPSVGKPLEILIASDGDNDSVVAMKRSKQLLQTFDGNVTMIMVGPQNDVVAREVAGKKLNKLAKKLDELTVKKKIELADHIVEGINRQKLESFDMVFIGTRNTKKIIRIIKDHDSNTDEHARRNLAIIREAVPFADKVWGKFEALIRGIVPQLEREDRVNLVEQLQTSSSFNFDFVALISLSTLIAALGLVLDSGAVVIGAMLVAPLMTPLVGTGFSLVQGNTKLVKNAVKSVLFGFAVAFLLAVGVGLIITVSGWLGLSQQMAVTGEMEARGHPTIIDLVVALASGIAGAYAMGRPNLVSAIPGVAIAAALVPPIATSGMALSMALFGNYECFHLSIFSSLLFLTNIIAITLGTTFVFWGVGINDEKIKSGSGDRPAPTWPRVLFLILVILSFGLAVFMTIENAQDKTKAEQEMELFQQMHDRVHGE